ncbi:MAG: PAS domain S-box protein [Pseudomonadota bacterium]
MRILFVTENIEQQYLDYLKSDARIDILDVCNSSSKAKEKISNLIETFDLVLVDQDLPELSGLEFCQQLRGQGLTLPLVLLVPDNFDAGRANTSAFGIETFLVDSSVANPFSKLPSALNESRRYHNDRMAREEVMKGLLENLERLERIVEASTIPSFVINKQHCITEWNKACEVLTGLSAEKMIGTKNSWQAFYASPRTTILELVVDGLIDNELEKVSSGQYRKASFGYGYEAEDFFPDFPKGGEWLFITAAPLRNQKGKIFGAVASLQNISEHRRAIEKLEKSARWVTQILNCSSVPTFVIDINHKVTHWNHACEIITGVPSSQVIGTSRHWHPFYKHPRKTMADLILDNVIESEIARHYTSGYRKSLLGSGFEAEAYYPNLGDGGSWLFFTASPLRSASGEMVGAIETLQDITDRRKAEDALAKNRQWLSQIIQGSAVPTFVIDSEHRISEWNLACENMTGVPAKQMTGTKDQWKAFSIAQRPVLADLIIDGATEEKIASQYGDKYRHSLLGEGYEVEDFFPNLGIDGKWLFFTASPLRDVNGEIIGAIETLQDVTRRKKAEDALRASEEHYRELSKMLLKQMEIDKDAMGIDLQKNIDNLVLPFFSKLRESVADSTQKDMLSAIESNLKQISSPVASRITKLFSKLTPAEVQIANLIKNGHSTKEIASLLYISEKTVFTHRRNIRKKCNIANKKVNLMTILQQEEAYKQG